MSLFRKKWLLALCMGAMAVIGVQTGLCAAEHAGLLPCAEQSSGHCESSTEEPSPSHCCHAQSHSDFVAVEIAKLIFSYEPSERFVVSQDRTPDAPVRKVDYPPQLS